MASLGNSGFKEISIYDKFRENIFHWFHIFNYYSKKESASSFIGDTWYK